MQRGRAPFCKAQTSSSSNGPRDTPVTIPFLYTHFETFFGPFQNNELLRKYGTDQQPRLSATLEAQDSTEGPQVGTSWGTEPPFST